VHHIGLSRDEITRVQQIIARLDAQPLGPGADRREHPRIDFNHPLWLHLPTEPGKPWVHIFSRNLSTSGLSFLSRKLLYAGQHLIISHELNEKEPQLVLSQVCFCRSIELGIQEVGLTFRASQPDPEKKRNIPPQWLPLVLQSDWLARQKVAQPLVAGAVGR
jgi:hypothetical protein